MIGEFIVVCLSLCGGYITYSLMSSTDKDA